MSASTENPATAKSSSRRALLAGAVGGIGAVAAGAVAKVSPVRGGVDGDVVLGVNNTATTTTKITNSSNSATVFTGQSTGAGVGVSGVSSTYYGVFGYSNSGIGVHGSSTTSEGVFGYSTDDIGVSGLSDSSVEPGVRGWATQRTGVMGYSGGTPPPAKPKTGVYGYANQDAGSKGVWGFSGRGVGVYGKANKNGIALRASGRIKADKVSGVATIPAGNGGVTVNPGVNVTSGSFLLLTPKSNIGSRSLSFVTYPGTDRFRIRMSATRGSSTKVAWLLLG